MEAVRAYQRKKARPKMPEVMVIPAGFISRWDILSDSGPPAEGKGGEPDSADADQQRWSGTPSLLDLSFAGDMGGENRSGTNI
jgi:hypothetical protein